MKKCFLFHLKNSFRSFLKRVSLSFVYDENSFTHAIFTVSSYGKIPLYIYVNCTNALSGHEQNVTS